MLHGALHWYEVEVTCVCLYVCVGRKGGGNVWEKGYEMKVRGVVCVEYVVSMFCVCILLYVPAHETFAI